MTDFIVEVAGDIMAEIISKLVYKFSMKIKRKSK